VRVIRPIDGGFEVDSGGGKFTSRFVVIATGASVKKLGVPGEADYEGRGVSQCADCDGPMFSGAVVVVAGAGDWALQEAMVLAQECAIVNVVHEGEELVACRDYVDAARAQPKIRFHAATAIEEVLGNASGMTGLRLRDRHGARRELAAAGLFVMTGLDATGGLAPAQVARDEHGHLRVNSDLETAVPGLWAIGLVRSGFGGWLADAAADARRVAALVKARMG
ncbi:MAG: NAD(P)/FAD-dependent oxidoreductase, partial [Burkholderiales bacterium]